MIDFCPSLQKPNLDFCAHGHSFVRFLHNSRVCFWHAFWKAKPCQKPFQNEAWTLQKSMPETCRFSISIFRKFGLDLGGPWVSKMEPSWPCWPPKTSELLFFYPLKLQVFKKWCLGRLQARFWRLRGSVLEGLGMIFKTFASFLARCLEDVSSSTPSSDFSHPGRAETSKKS